MKITKHQNTSVLPILQSGQGFTWTPEGLKAEELATWEDVPEDIKQLAKDINDREYEEHRRNNDVRFTGEKGLIPEDHLFASALAGGIGTAQAASTLGWMPAIATDAGAIALGTAGSYGGNKLGTYIDDKYETNTTPYLTFFGGLTGGILGGLGSYKGLVKTGSHGHLKGSGNMYGNQFRGDVVTDMLNRAEMPDGNGPLRHYVRYSLDGAHQTNVYDTLTGKNIGHISTTSADGPIDKVTHIIGEPQYRWKGRSLYSAESMETPRGLVSGINLEMPEATIPTWKHFDYEVIGDYGLHGNKSGQPVIRIKGPETYLPKVEPKVIEHVPTEAMSSGNTSYKMYEIPSTYFKDAKYAGQPGTYAGKEVPTWQLSKGERNQSIRSKTYNERQITPTLISKYEQINMAPELDPNYLENSIAARVKYKKQMSNKFENYFEDTDGFNKDLQSYIDELPREIDPRFASITDGEIIQPSIAVRGYRNYLLNNGVDAVDISDDDLARLLTQEYKNLSNTATGKLKNHLLWHGSPVWFDSFDFSKTSMNTGNSGALGPGNYFSLHGGRYGHTKNKFDYSMNINNFQPFIISDVTSTPSGMDMIEKGLLPEYISTAALNSSKNQRILQKLISEIPSNDNKAYLDFTEAVPGYFKGPKTAVMLRRNTGIKSLYPHPSRFVRNTDGTVTLKPVDWSDPRVNFKQGGVL